MSLNRVALGGVVLIVTLALTGCPGDDVPRPPADQTVSAADARDGSSAGDATDAAGDAASEAGVDAALCGGVSCNDNLACTTDTCTGSGCTNTLKSGHCLINKKCRKQGDKNPSATCQRCDTASSTTAWTDSDSLCPGASLKCMSAKCTAGACKTKIQTGYCVVGNVCVKNGAANPKNACRTCDTSKSVTSYQNAANGASCGGNNLSCSVGTCKTGQCAHAVKSGTCMINGVCYLKGELNPLVGCEVCDPAKSSSSWSVSANGATCADDGLACTTDACKGGKCVHTVKAGKCLIGSTCYKDGAKNPKSVCQSCNAKASGTGWTAKKNGTSCTADKYACTNDVCKAGACTHALKSGACLIGGTCYKAGDKKAGKDCTSCVPAKSTTSWSVATDGSACTADKYSCTGDVCKAGSCTHSVKANACLISGKCYATGAMHPTTPCSACNPSTSKSSWSAQPDGSVCKADSYSCTRDVCKGGACTHPLKPGFCWINGTCYGNGAKNPSNACQYCNPKLSQNSWNVLTNGTYCKADSLSCTQDVCSSGVCTHPVKPGFCKIGGTCYSSGAKHPTNNCLTCNPGSSTTSWGVASNGTPCGSDGKSCTTDVCSSGACTHKLKAGSCLIGNTCYSGGTQHPYLSCQYCNPGQAPYGWSPRPNGFSCNSDGKFCTADSCQGGTCAHTPMAGYCYISGNCYTSGQHMTSTSCHYCNPTKSTSGWSVYSYAGCCSGNVVRYCDAGIYKQLDCNINPVCGWQSAGPYYDCGTLGGSDPSGIHPKGC